MNRNWVEEEIIFRVFEEAKTRGSQRQDLSTVVVHVGQLGVLAATCWNWQYWKNIIGVWMRCDYIRHDSESASQPGEPQEVYSSNEQAMKDANYLSPHHKDYRFFGEKSCIYVNSNFPAGDGAPLMIMGTLGEKAPKWMMHSQHSHLQPGCRRSVFLTIKSSGF